MSNELARPQPQQSYAGMLQGRFRDLVLQAESSKDKYDLSGELAAMKGMLGELLARLTKKGELPVGDTVKLVKEIRETVKLASQQEGYIHILAVKHIVGEMMVIFREEAKDDGIIKRVAERLGKLAVPASRQQSQRFAEALTAGQVPPADA